MQPVLGIHHITAIAGDPQATLDFYHNLLGQRLIKRTVNFDDPGTYHFYFGDETGTPGTILTFFPWQGIPKGQLGNGEVAATAYAMPSASLDYWQERLAAQGVETSPPQERFGIQVFSFADPDGMVIELVADDSLPDVQVWEEGPVPAEHALRGFHSATMWVDEAAPTADLLTNQLGYTFSGQEGPRYRFQAGSDGVGSKVDLLERPGQPSGRQGAGTVHHIAYRTQDDAEQEEYLRALRAAGQHVSPVMDRQYFHSIYFRAPSGVLFEIATDAPGFLYDEPRAELGQTLKLPTWLEGRRREIAGMLPAIELTTAAEALHE